MLEHTFCHIPSVGVKTESDIWKCGLERWDDFLALDRAELISRNVPKRALSEGFRHSLVQSKELLARGDASHFEKALPASEKWRLLRPFSRGTCYLDIETTGLGKGLDHITTIAVFDGQTVHTFVHGRNLDDVVDCIRQYDLIVTFNGKCFDIPFMERFFNISIDTAHVDMRFVLKQAGVTGGLKKCEKCFGLDRGHLDGVDGYWAVLLWKEFERTEDERFLSTLLSYNIEDVLSLQVLAAHAHNMLLERTPFNGNGSPQGGLHLDVPVLADNPVKPDQDVIRHIRKLYFP